MASSRRRKSSETRAVGGTRATASFLSRYRHYGRIDAFLGVDKFWTEKWALFFHYLQDFALLWMFPVEWPWWFWGRSRFVLMFLLDFRTRRSQMVVCDDCSTFPDCSPPGCTSTLDAIKIFEREDHPTRSATALIPILVMTGIFLFWLGLAAVPDLGLIGPSLARNIERIMFPLLVVLYAPYLVQVMYTTCDYDSFVVEEWDCSFDGASWVYFLLACIFILGFPYMIFHRVRTQTVFKSELRHESLLRTRELEYMLRLNTLYRDKRFWLFGSFTRQGAFTQVYFILHKLVYVCLLALACGWAGSTTGRQALSGIVFAGFVIPALLLTSGILRLYRVGTSHWLQALFMWTNSFNSLVGYMRVMSVTNPLFTDRELRQIMSWLNLGVAIFFFCFLLFLYVATHDFLSVLWKGTASMREEIKQREHIYGARVSEKNKKHMHLGKALKVLIREEYRRRKARLGYPMDSLSAQYQPLSEGVRTPPLGMSAPMLVVTGDAPGYTPCIKVTMDRDVDTFSPEDFTRDIVLLHERSLAVENVEVVEFDEAAHPYTITIKFSGLPDVVEFSHNFVARCTTAKDSFKESLRVMYAEIVDPPQRVNTTAADTGEADLEGVVVLEKTLVESNLESALHATSKRLGVRPSSAAGRLGLSQYANRELTHVGGTEVRSPGDIRAAVDREASETIELRFGRELDSGSAASEHQNGDTMSNGRQPDGPREMGNGNSNLISPSSSFHRDPLLSPSNRDHLLSSPGSGSFRSVSFKFTPTSQALIQERAERRGSADYELSMLRKLLGRNLAEQELYGDYWDDDDGDDLVAVSFRCFPPSTNVQFVWPVGAALVGEIIKENRTNRFLDVLREAKAVLMEVTFLHSTPELIRAETLMFHIRRVRRCIRECNKLRVAHHLQAIHPLAPTFEETLDELVHEYKVNKPYALAVGRRAAKLPIVSAYLHHRLNQRKRYLALVRPVMRRVLLKLLVLRMFIELVGGQREELLPSTATMRKKEEVSPPPEVEEAEEVEEVEEVEEEEGGKGLTVTSLEGAVMAKMTLGGKLRKKRAKEAKPADEPVEDVDIKTYDIRKAVAHLHLELAQMVLQQFAAYERDETATRAQIVGEEKAKRREINTARQVAVVKQREKEHKAFVYRKQVREALIKDEAEHREAIRKDEHVEWSAWVELSDDLVKESKIQAKARRERIILGEEERSDRAIIEAEWKNATGLMGIKFGREKTQIQQRDTERRKLAEAEAQRQRMMLAAARAPEVAYAASMAVLAIPVAELLPPPPPSSSPPSRTAFGGMIATKAVTSLARARRERSPAKQELLPGERSVAPSEVAGRQAQPAPELPAELEEEPVPKKDPLKIRKAKLVKKLNEWKKQYREVHGKDPTTRDIMKDPVVSEAYKEFTAIQEGRVSLDKELAAPSRSTFIEEPPSTEPLSRPPSPPSRRQSDTEGEGTEKEGKKAKSKDKARKKVLVKQLEAWKASYKEKHGKEPTKRVLASDPAIASVYEEYLALKAAEKGVAMATPTEEAPGRSSAPQSEAEQEGAEQSGKKPKARKAELVKQLNAWKEQYRASHGKEPTKKVLLADPEIGPTYKEYQELQAQRKEKKKEKEAKEGEGEEEGRSGAEVEEGGEVQEAEKEEAGQKEEVEEEEKEKASEEAARGEVGGSHEEPQKDSDAGAAEDKEGDSPTTTDEARAALVNPDIPFADMDTPQLKKHVKGLVKVLNEWKASYEAEHGKQPTKSVLRSTEGVREVYEAYTVASTEAKKRKGQ